MNIIETLYNSYKQKKKVRIKYYSLSSDEIKWRTISIYKYEKNFIIAYCYLRKEERTFVKNRIKNAKMLEEKYKIPKNWTPKSNVWN